MLNKQGPGKIDWTDWTWNPISGCKNNPLCPYCYMLRMEKRFPGTMEPKFKPEYIKKFQQTRKVKPGDKVFVGSSGDMWGEWVPSSWIMPVLEAAILRPSITFQFLTKNPAGYHSWAFSENMWLGTTVDGTIRTRRNIEILFDSVSDRHVRFISFEPLLSLEWVDFNDLIPAFDWIIIGADSTKGARKPPKEWADYLIATARNFNIPVWVKDNYGYTERIKEFPEVKTCS